jgi:pyridoxamine 5'-phosphate oxidase
MTSKLPGGTELSALDESAFLPNPIDQFRLWYQAALAHVSPLPNAVTLATATPDGRPSARMVLLKDFDERGFVFFTNYDSRKGGELRANPWAALCFYWGTLDRQIRIEGRVSPISASESDAYFQTRPAGSRISASVSPQSEVIPGREFLERRARELLADYPTGSVPRPANWGGYRLVPDSIEFWLSRTDRLHDRLRYQRRPEGSWRLDRLAP